MVHTIIHDFKKDNYFDNLVIVEEDTMSLTGKDFDLTCYPAVRDTSVEMFKRLDDVFNREHDLHSRADDFASIWNEYI